MHTQAILTYLGIYQQLKKKEVMLNENKIENVGGFEGQKWKK